MQNLHIQPIGLLGRVFTNGLGDRSSIPGWVIPKTKIWYLMPPCLTLSIITYISRVKLSNPRKGVAPFPTLQRSSYCKESLRVTLNCQLYLLTYPNAILFSILNFRIFFCTFKTVKIIIKLISIPEELWKFIKIGMKILIHTWVVIFQETKF